MELNKLTDDLTVAGQIDLAVIPLLAERGIRAIICNRPDGEAPGQPSFREVEQTAAANGMKAVYLPVPSNAISNSDAYAFEEALNGLPKPVIAYCRSGTRCAVLWSLSQADKLPIQDILLKAIRAGYDLSSLVPRLEKLRRP
ncbi:MAG: TIGR01244 family phosphatase [Rhodomicrobium sp.]|nr:TIGR01244 family phosphatase [Rhodomicrobium sp.]